MLGLLVGILAQSCAVMLPATTIEFEWFRDGRPYAQDVLLRTRGGERLYQRRLADGTTAERVVSCQRSGRAVYLVDRIGSAPAVRLPLDLAPGALRRIGNAVVRRVAPPPGAAANLRWYLVANPGARLFATRAAAGITEVRTPTRGGYSVLRAIARNRASRVAADSQFAALAQRVAELENENRRLRDSLSLLRAAARPGDSIRPGTARKSRPPVRDPTASPDTTAPRGPADSTMGCCVRAEAPRR